MPPYLPPAERARQRLLRKAEALSLVHVPGKGSKHLLFFSCEVASGAANWLIGVG
jgi:hypothetical protein